MIKAYPKRVVLTDSQGMVLTYNDMANRVNLICVALQKEHIAGVVGVFQSPTPDFICTILAILRMGFTYVPLDLRAGTARLASIVAECQPAGIVIDPFIKGELSALGSYAVAIDISALPSPSSKQFEIKAEPDTIAAMIFTSGSTGIPKGICLSHASLRNNLELANH